MDYLFLECVNSTTDIKPSEYIFWKDLLGFKGEIVCCGGNRNMVKEIISHNINSDDSIYIFLDSINQLEDAAGYLDLLNSIESTCNLLGLSNVFLNIDFCFESIFLRSSILLEAWKNGICYKNASLYNNISQIYQLHVDFIKFYSGDLETANDIVSLLNNLAPLVDGKKVTLEQTVASLVQNISQGSGFVLNKGKMGYCWICDCGTKSQNEGVYYYDRGKFEICGRYINDKACILCRRNVNFKRAEFLSQLSNTKRKVVLDDLCNGDWHNLFEPL